MNTECRKRSLDEPIVETKRPRYSWYFKLESESSCASQEDDTESVYSIQNQETDVARDTSDTDTKSDESDKDLHVELEYEVATTSDSDNPLKSSSSGTDDALAAAGAVAAVICNSSLEAWATDAEDSDSSLDGSASGRTDFGTCLQCKSKNDNPLFRYCERCFQVRKSFFPPRPRKHRKNKTSPSSSQENPVKLESLQSCLNGLSSQDSGIGSSQEFPSLQLDKIVIPKHLTSGNLSDNNSSAECSGSRKRQYSESSLSEFDDIKTVKRNKSEKADVQLEQNAVAASHENKLGDKTEIASKEVDKESVALESKDQGNLNANGEVKEGDEGIAKPCLSFPEPKELCIMCNSSPKNSIFLHGRIAHMCCCYKCAIRTWGMNKRCPVCNCKVRNVVKVFTI